MIGSNPIIYMLSTKTRKRKLNWQQASLGDYSTLVGTVRFILSRDAELRAPVLTIITEDDAQDFCGPDTNELFDEVRAQVLCADDEIMKALQSL